MDSINDLILLYQNFNNVLLNKNANFKKTPHRDHKNTLTLTEIL